MRNDFETIKSDFLSINATLKDIAVKIEENLTEMFSGFEHIDKIGCRIKGENSFLDKTLKEDKGVLKYKTPLKEIQDIIGARVVVYYKSDVEKAIEQITKFYRFVEQKSIIPDDVTKFGYEGQHFICFIPSTIYASHKTNLLIPDFFELQIKTLYQHAWSQSEHGLGYKPGSKLTYDEERKLAFIAAQSWGADRMLMDLLKTQETTN